MPEDFTNIPPQTREQIFRGQMEARRMANVTGLEMKARQLRKKFEELGGTEEIMNAVVAELNAAVPAVRDLGDHLLSLQGPEAVRFVHPQGNALKQAARSLASATEGANREAIRVKRERERVEAELGKAEEDLQRARGGGV